MDAPLTILWIESPAPDIEEIRFSYDFCRRMSRHLCEATGRGWSWIDCPGDSPVGKILPQIHGDRALIVTQPEIVLSPSAISILAGCLDKGVDVCGPAYNQTAYAHQTAALPCPYVDMDSYVEVAELLAQSSGHQAVPVDSLDSACILCRIALLKELPGQALFSELPAFISKMAADGMAVAPGALVHSGFIKGFETERVDLVRLVPEGVKQVLDIGCAMGGYGKVLKEKRPEIVLTGVELNPVMAASASHYYDRVFDCPVEDAGITDAFDLVNCGDILEHLQDPWRTLRYLQGLLKKGGYLVLSIPNVGHWSVVKALLRGHFQYVPLGLLCIGHLRWFTESSIRTALEQAGFAIEVFQRQQIPPTPEGEHFIREMYTGGFGDERSLRTNEFTLRAVKKSN